MTAGDRHEQISLVAFYSLGGKRLPEKQTQLGDSQELGGVKKILPGSSDGDERGWGSPHPGALRRRLTAYEVLVCCVAWLRGVINSIMFCNYPLCVHCGPRGPKLRPMGAAASSLQGSRSGRGLTAALGNCLYTVSIQTVAQAAFDGGSLWPLVMTDNVKFPHLKINK